MKRLPVLLSRTWALLSAVCLSGVSVFAQAPAPTRPGNRPAPANDLDAFMERVLARREVNRKTLEQYILDETESFEILGPGRWPLHRTRREYSWYVRDGMHVRSPVRFNGVKVGEEARERYETNWIRRERDRQERKAKGEKESGEVSVGSEGVQISSGNVVPTEPRFVSEAYFMDFKFEPGNYYLAGREKLEGQEVLRVEYYPTKMFDDTERDKNERKQGDTANAAKEKSGETREERREKQVEDDINRRMNKTALITLWIDPAEHQIVKYTFDNVWLDFLPGAWLVKIDDIRASMTMGQPFPGVWLPREMNIHSAVTLANGSFEAGYERRFSEYRLAEVGSKIRVPKREDEDDEPRDRGPFVSNAAFEAPAETASEALAGVSPSSGTRQLRATPASGTGRARVRHRADAGQARVRHGAATGQARVRHRADTGQLGVRHGAGSGQVGARHVSRTTHVGGRHQAYDRSGGIPQQNEVIGEIRIHGNAFLTDKEVTDFAGIAVGQPLGEDGVAVVTKRLKDSGRFESVDVRKRYRSLDSTTDVALILVVHEKPGVRSAIGGVSIPGVPDKVARPVGRLRSKLMFLPIISFADGYGFTYGGRVSTVDLLGFDERLSVPLTWGGTRRAALEFERLFKTGPLTRIDSSVAIWNRENPRFEIRDQRVEVKGRAERVFADVFRTGIDASRATISFGTLDDKLWTLGTSAAVDTRLDPAFPGNAVLASVNWTGMHFDVIPSRVNRYSTDLRGYLRTFRQIVVAGRAAYTAADASLPPYERLLLGGSSSVRGFHTGDFDGDRTFVSALELRAPITSVLSGAKLGVTAFYDAGKAWDFGSTMKSAEWHRGVGGGVFLIASIVRINLDVARGLKTGDTHVHLSSGFTF